MSKEQISILNKKAKFEYEFLEKFEAGLQLMGTEVKSLRTGNASIAEAYCAFEDGELFLINAHIAEFKFGNINNHQPLRKRKLLLHKKELKKLEGKLKDKGLTIVPIRVFQSDRGFAKIEIALARGKKAFDKREDIKKRDVERELSRYRD
ncbi:MAG: SsrA-binding protein SmpB [Bacteroidota bacterium]|nr:SsrA-binding protein SmpB [Bacteroidota bacterium]MDX5431913.1 SsrA-binding protein SmpB [Bacteroidota bacterium]MDX5470628.1 SsrA-binding protein SmpB [Bacteroidota bacterium]